MKTLDWYQSGDDPDDSHKAYWGRFQWVIQNERTADGRSSMGCYLCQPARRMDPQSTLCVGHESTIEAAKTLCHLMAGSIIQPEIVQ